ncbi:carbohydrate ABC transporter permease [Paenibacillus periandrae]|uniref:carbohydrate ABC transporter permease n=1 Tax=Paenibacillus periandrae TaxID=1761741 RepID=UPI001F098287|nr:carbohydrate ABC transporter permease [Paenibacillus periandrae]
MSSNPTASGPSYAAKITINLLFVLLTVVMVMPLLLVISISLSEEKNLLLNGYRLLPETFSFTAYQLILNSPAQLLKAYGVTIFVTVTGLVLSLLFTAMIAFSISRKDYKYARITTLYVFFTMLFSGGLVPFYILVTQYLHLKDSIWALIIPYLLSPFNVLILKGFLEKLPSEIFESAKMDGASEYRIFFRIVLPLSTPALATVGLFIAFAYWNDWWLGLLFIDNQNLVPLQLLLYRIMNTIEFMTNNIDMVNVQIDLTQFPSLSARMAMAVLAAGPMMFVFPFFQRYFVAGLTVGSVKS